MNAVLLVCHGSRNQKSNQQFVQFAEMVQKKCKADLFHYAFLELASPTILDQIDRCVQAGAKKVIVFPLLLLAAGHAKVDIPKEIAKAKKHHPNVFFQLEQPLGMQDILISILKGKLSDASYDRSTDSLILFVGRGSNDSGAIAQFKKIKEKLSVQLGTNHVRDCYLVGGDLSFETAISEAKSSQYERIFILPYLLFNGVLLTRMKKKIYNINDKRLTLCEPIGVDEKLVDLVSDMLNERVI